MSGTNPFRRREVPAASQPHSTALDAGADALNRAGIPFPPIDTGVQKSTKTKTVRIISPHYSRNKDERGIFGTTSPPPHQFDDSPPPEADSPSSAEALSPSDPFSAQSDEGTSQDDDEDLRRNTSANMAPVMPQNIVNMQLPHKPSTKAPALRFGGDVSTIGSRDESDRAALIESAGRPLYDVDDFKRLLLTGERLRTEKIMPTIPPAQVQSLQMGDSNSNTDASSISRQSIFEPHSEVRSESPRTSVDVSPSDEERQGLVQPSLSSNVGRSRPTVPPSRHGKLVKPNTAQTVSFESLTSSPPDLNSAALSSTEPLSPISPRNTTDLSKPLPPPPKPESPIPTEVMPVVSATGAEENETNLYLPHHPDRVHAKRSPPVLPTPRRRGQGRERSSTNDSNQSSPLSEDPPQNTHPSPSSPSITTPKPPPIPPPRRAGTAPGSENTGPILNVDPSTFSKETPAFKPHPPAPPSRTPSTASIKRMSRISTASSSSGAAAPPPPPAPRRRGSSQSQISFTPSRLSGEYRISTNERPRGDSGASLTQQPALSEMPAEGKDLVGDLAALQKEVDELRGKFGR
ncbi:MAG: hypothetical protein Q9171_000011 [Xanthocarpia ochracea]